MTERSFKISSMFMFFVSRYFHMGARLNSLQSIAWERNWQIRLPTV